MSLMEIANGIITKDSLDDISKEYKSRIDLCRRLRNLAKLDRIKLDESMHNNNLNLALIKYLKLCNKDVLRFVKDYISNLQPFMIERRPSEEYSDTVICVLDKYYSISLYIKVDSLKMQEIIVSFHESHSRGIGRLNFGSRRNERVPIIANSVDVSSELGNTRVVEVLIQRGILVVPIKISARAYGSEYYVIYSDIERELVGICNEYIEEIYAAATELNIDQIKLFSTLQQLSFPSYGRDLFSKFSLLIDSFFIQENEVSRSAADFAIVTVARQQMLDTVQRDELLGLLREKFSIQSRKGLSDVLDRIEANLEVVVDI